LVDERTSRTSNMPFLVEPSLYLYINLADSEVEDDWRRICRPPKGRSNMSDIDIPGYGKLWVANKLGLPLLLVFGGIAVRPSQMDGISGIKRNKDEDKPVQSDVYMWNYMNALKDRFHIFVSLPPRHVDGPKGSKGL
jgi:hypothetical protein